jgi:polar amino acid transport system substrate-binding protein
MVDTGGDSKAVGILMNYKIVIVLVSFVMAGCISAANAQPDQVFLPANQTVEPSSMEKVIRLTNGEWIPYTGKDLLDHGCDSKIVAEVFSRSGYRVEFGFYPWARGYHLAESGEWDGMTEWADTKEARQSFFVSKEAISHQEFVFFHRVDHPIEWETKDDLAGMVIGLTSGYLYSDQFVDLMNDNRYIFQEASSDEANFEKLIAGRIDIFPMERNVGLAMLRSQFPKEQADLIKFDHKPLSAFEPHVFLTKKDPVNEKIIALFDREFESFKTSQDYLSITKSCIQ